jgi:hypothetical protein
LVLARAVLHKLYIYFCIFVASKLPLGYGYTGG